MTSVPTDSVPYRAAYVLQVLDVDNWMLIQGFSHCLWQTTESERVEEEGKGRRRRGGGRGVWIKELKINPAEGSKWPPLLCLERR